MGIHNSVLPKSVTAETVSQVHHWTDHLFSFRLSRPAGFRFRSGEFVMIGLPGEERPVLRAYSLASPSWDDGLDFYSIKVADGALTSRLQKIKVGDTVLLGKKPTGTLVLDALLPGRTLYLLSTGTGLAPFASIIRDPETYDRFDTVVLTHTCRKVAELAYGQKLVDDLRNDPLIGEFADRLTYFGSVTREPHIHRGRITDLIASGEFFEAIDEETFDQTRDRVMICGSMNMIQDTRSLILDAGLTEGSNSMPGEFVVEKAFVD